jgi:signal peptide peptidase SppA
MSEQIARAALARMNMREVAISTHCNTLAADLRQMALADAKVEAERFDERRSDLCAAYGYSTSEQRKPFAFAEGMAIIPVSGSLINRFGGSWGWVTGYNFIRSQINLALADDDVKGIILDLNSYGGEAAGVFELSTDIRAARDQKPILGVIDSNCYSACYAIGSACSRLVITPSGGAGSIGVVAMHVNQGPMLEQWGLEVTLIHSGDHKVDGNPFEKLSKEVRADIQKGVDKSRAAFVALVAENRNMDAQAVHDTEARIYRAEDAVALGLVDAIATPTEAVQAFFTELSGSTSTEEMSMDPKVNEPGAADKAAADKAAADQAAANQQAAADARTAERTRIAGITQCEEAKGREKLASHLALSTDMSVDAAKAVLAASAQEAAPAPAAAANPFKEAMDGGKHPEVGVDAGAKGGENGDGGENMASQILAAQSMATGVKH